MDRDACLDGDGSAMSDGLGVGAVGSEHVSTGRSLIERFERALLSHAFVPQQILMHRHMLAVYADFLNESVAVETDRHFL